MVINSMFFIVIQIETWLAIQIYVIPTFMLKF